MEHSNSVGQVANTVGGEQVDIRVVELTKRTEDGFQYMLRASLVQFATALIALFFVVVVMGLATWPRGYWMVGSLTGALLVGICGQVAYISSKRKHDMNKDSTTTTLKVYYIFNLISMVVNVISIGLDSYYLTLVIETSTVFNKGVDIGLVIIDIIVSILLIAIHVRIMIIVYRKWDPLNELIRAEPEIAAVHIPLHGL